MNRLNIRQFKRDAVYDNGTIAFATPVSFPSATVGGVDVGTALAGGHAHGDTGVVYVDSKQTGSYTETGHESTPYRTLTAAVAAKLGNSATQYTVFKLLPGNYDGAISVDKDAPNQSFEIIGSGRDNTFIRSAATFSAAANDNVLYFRDFLDITIRHLSITTGKYGFYPRNCRNIKVIDCEFKWLGSDGTDIYHDQSQTMASQAAFWAGSQTSNGGTCRIRSCADVLIDGCRSSFSARGFRIQDCSSGLITNTRGYKLLEAFVYLASGSYDGNPANGCSNFVVSGCSCDTIFHSGYLCIGGKSNTFINCSVSNCASSPFNTWHANGVQILSCSAHNTLTKTYIGIGVEGDSFGQVYKGGDTQVNTDGYELVALNNSFTQCGIGRSESGDSTTFYFVDNASNASSRVIIDGNHSDATVGLFNPDSVVQVLGQYPAVVPGPSQAAFDSLSSDVTDNTSGIAENVTDIQTNATAISGLSGFSGTADRAVVTDGSGALASSAVTKSQLLNLQNVTSDVQGQLDNRLKLDTTQSLTSGTLRLSSNGNQQLFLSHTGYADLKLYSNFGQAGIDWKGGTSTVVFDGGRTSINGVMFRPPTGTSDPGDPAATCKGCIFVDSSTAGAWKPRFHDGTQWRFLTLS